MKEKVRCKICGKVGLLSDKKGLMRHMRLIHNTCVSKKGDINAHFDTASPDSIIEIKSDYVKSFFKEKNRKWNKRIINRNKDEGKNPFVRIIYTPMGNNQ